MSVKPLSQDKERKEAPLRLMSKRKRDTFPEMRLLIRHQGKRSPVELEEPFVLGTLRQKVSECTGIAANRQVIKVGFPPQPIDTSLADDRPLSDVPIADNEMLVVEEGAERSDVSNGQQQTLQAPPTASPPPSAPQQNGGSSQARPASCAAEADHVEKVERKVVPADNSCLFNCIRSIVDPSKSNMDLRRIIRDAVRRDPDRFSEAILGRPTDRYCEWILKSESWGGFIELMIFAEYYRTQFSAIDVQTLRVDSYGESEQYPKRGLLLYDGIHYDYFVGRKAGGGEVTLFDPADDMALGGALEIADDLKTRKQYTDTAGMTIRCLVCAQAFKGEKEAVEHCKQTGHTNFDQIEA
ncbi:unnamed protein product [Vitrella brassicaformis CCMP3155]|uniref:Ubiquitin thioesterase OTU n=2 Tax=Vitrella brassicaformis TaxID=1169539 RepID=A0A0G4FKV0_VITBC|nr:unnamed protein product [Vitrella brassicaformis CCMP3155]|eukprot:CEM14586.1 unnamed protein product [Vitrella brassicaformis CCMP3155]